jgi:hypothetical protein
LQASPEATPGQASGNSSTREAVKKAANDQLSPELWSVHCLREAFEQARPMLAGLTAVFTHHPLPIAWGIRGGIYEMHEQAFTITIKPAEESQLDVLENEFSPDTLSKHHYKRYEVQKQGEGVYLIAWHDHTPVGHFLLRWSGPDDARVMKYVDVTKTAYLEAGATSAAYRRMGVAAALIREAERVAR